MGDLDVQLTGLRTFAAQCGSEAVELSGAAAPVSAGPVFQPTTAAVTAVSAAVTAMAARLSDRAETTGVKMDAAATTFAEQERRSATQIAATTPTFLV
ncbi:type VII secretion target [Mycolicibacterium confluentis]|uniref:Uncharacterized protein n=1 Tax=Mycolicibacterium confluentis TaxID=28047 RepID=A0A7I7XT16_9MYCO|nr:type VII secretion target [Mycolicibacterium confluentis]MCV7321125.1 hypothetical protein [Mycolicibacterium confluentis]ORV21278.1 hypothetical protein AWB99_27125 [Mycolicibacterium confluentis]BBZ32399.1 hypothetical protein MCNF_10040 [Mycolicibacterium confluentis]